MSDVQAPLPSEDSLQRLLAEGSFEQALAALEGVVVHLEKGRLPLEEAIQWYESGLLLSRRCQELLEHAELRIEMLDQQYASREWSGEAEEVDDE